MQNQLPAVDDGWQKIIVSPARRCRAFAEAHFTTPLDVNALWQERDFGEWDGLSFDQVEAIDTEGLQAYLEDPFQARIPGAESYDAFGQRIREAWSGCLEQALSEGVDSMLLITHGGPIRLLLQQVLKLPDEALFQWRIGYGCRVSLEATSTEQGPFIQLTGITQGGAL